VAQNAKTLLSNGPDGKRDGSLSLLDQAWADFYLSRQALRCTPRTLEHYRYTAGQFVRWLASEGIHDPKPITARLVRSYLERFADRADTTQHAQARGVKTFVLFLAREGYIEQAPRVDLPRLGRPKLPVLDAAELARVLACCELSRDRALVLFLADTGTRLAETVALTWGDVDLVTGQVSIRAGKGRKARLVVCGSEARRAMLAWRRDWTRERGQPPEPADPLWLAVGDRHHGRPLGRSGVRLVMVRLSQASGIHVTAHALRRTFATLALRAGMPVPHLQALLGHTTVAMVMRYVTLTADDLQAAQAAHSPVDAALGRR